MPFDVEERFIATAEEALGCKLPKALRARLAVRNGGELLTANEDWLLFPVPDRSSKKRLLRTFNDMIKETASARQWPHFPSDAIAVASNGCGDLLIVFPQSDEIFEWHHETGAVAPAHVKLI
jgi:hypothetical protein